MIIYLVASSIFALRMAFLFAFDGTAMLTGRQGGRSLLLLLPSVASLVIGGCCCTGAVVDLEEALFA